MSLCVVTGTVLDSGSNPISGVPVGFNTQTPTLSSEPVAGLTTTDGNGNWSLSISQGTSGIFTVKINQSGVSNLTSYFFNALIPAASSAAFSQVVVN